MSTTLPLWAARLRRSLASDSVGEQLLVLGAQLSSGLGNFAFSVVMARLLEPSDFAVLRVFLALYLLLNVPAGSMGAGSALDPDVALRARGRALRVGVALALAAAVAAVPVGVLLAIPVPVVLVLALSFPAIGSRALLRGRLWGTGRHRRGAVSLLVDVLVRLGAGTVLAWMFGPIGGAVGVVLGGYASLAVVSERDAGPAPGPGAASGSPTSEGGAAWWTTGAFFALAWMFNQDLLLANKLLPAAEAARFAGVSTVGGTAAFATMAIPWLLLPRAARGDSHALRVAITLAALAGGSAVAVVALWPAGTATLVLGSRYASIAPLLPSYMLAMAVFGLARVLVAQRCASGKAKESLLLTALFAAVQAGAIVFFADDASGVVVGTLVATTALAAGFALVVAWPRITGLVASARSLVSLRGRRRAAALPALLAAATALRLVFDRGLWVDEAITVSTAQQSFPEMLETLRTSDVHPPLHYAAVWTVMRSFGRTEMELRSISIISGILLVAVLYALGREFFDNKTAIVAGLFGAACPLLIWYSQEARMYSVVMLLAATAVWAQVRAVRSRSPGWWGLYILSSAAMLWTHYMTIFQVVVQQLAFVVVVWRSCRSGDGRLLRQWAVAMLTLVALVSPLVPFAMDQLEAIRARQAGKVPSQTPLETGESVAKGSLSIYALLANIVWALLGYHSDSTMNRLVALWPLGMLPALAVLGRGRLSGGTRLLSVGAIVPILALFGIGFLSRNLFEVRYFATAVPLIVLLGARMVTKCATTTRSFAVVLAAVLASLLIAGADQQLSAANPRIYDFRGAIAEVRKRSSSEKDVIVYRPQFLGPVVHYYAPNLRSSYAANDLPRRRPDARVFVLASFLEKPNVARSTGTLLAVLEEGYELAGRFERAQVRVWVFEPDLPNNREGKRKGRPRGRD